MTHRTQPAAVSKDAGRDPVRAWPRLRESRTVHAGRAPGTVIRCGLKDIMMADLPVSLVFFFEAALDEERLAAGLARALDHVPVFAGRLRTCDDGSLEIVCNDAGVPMTCYDIDETVADAISRVTLPGSNYADHLDGPGARLHSLPLLSVRVSRLAGGGTAVGCCWHHAVGDLHSFMLLMRSWSAAVEGGPLPEVIVHEDPEAYLDKVLPRADTGRPDVRLLSEEDAADLQREVESALRANRTVQVYFGDAEVARMREEFTAVAGRKVSANDALCAHLATTLRQLDEDQETRRMSIPVNFRRHVDIPPAVLGNLTSEIHLRCPAGGAPQALAAEIRAAVEDFAHSHLSLRANRAFVESVGLDRLRDFIPGNFDPGKRSLTITNWSRAGLYDVAFEGHHPVFFSPLTNLQLPWVSWLVEGFDGAGHLYMVTLPARLAARLRAADGRAALHRYRDPAEPLPPLAQQVRKLA